MEAAAPYAAAPRGPRNLTLPLAAWLRRMGFAVLEQGNAGATGTWAVPDCSWRFQLTYAYSAEGGGILQLLELSDEHRPGVKVQVQTAHVARLRECRFLLLSNAAYADARRAALAAGTLLPAHAQPA